MFDDLVEYILQSFYAYSTEIIFVSICVLLLSIFAWILGAVSFSCLIESEYSYSITKFLGFILPYLLFVVIASTAILFCLSDGNCLFVVSAIIPMSIFDARVDIESSHWDLSDEYF